MKGMCEYVCSIKQTGEVCVCVGVSMCVHVTVAIKKRPCFQKGEGRGECDGSGEESKGGK